MGGAGEKLYTFPRLERVALHSFSLFSREPNTSVEMPNGVLCMAGANGIGKSTFLNAVNYGLTGAVASPRRRLLSAQAYFKDAIAYSSEYFSGRIREQDRSSAAVTVEFSINDKRFSLTRGLFSSDDVRSFSINGSPILPTAELGISELYQKRVVTEIGLNTFDQFVFLQHFVFTFDEARKLLFWDQQATALALYLCFGGDPAEAERADTLQRDAERAGSRGRNAQFQVNNTRKRISAIESSLGPAGLQQGEPGDLDEEYEKLESARGNAQEQLDRLEAQFAANENDVTQWSAAIAQLRAAYNETFNQLLSRTSKAHDHPLICQTINDGVCGICSTTGDEVVSVLKQKLSTSHCPLCDSALEATLDQTEIHRSLAQIDDKLADGKARLDEAIATRKRLGSKLEECRTEAIKARERLSEFEDQHEEVAETNKALRALANSPVARTLEALKGAMAEFVTQRDEEYALRDSLWDELKILQADLADRYALAETTFVPRFRELAELFLGIDLDISIKTIAPIGMKFVVDLRGTERLDENQMSESQRFFVDIALRMALTGQMSKEQSPVTLLIDTPEGSLDIAYEDRAGEMFAAFVEKNNSILMTANINSSKLLTTLARRCGTKRMSITDMTGWTELSEVQQAASGLFEDAFEHISSALQQGPMN